MPLPPKERPRLPEIASVFFAIGWQSFGGPASHIALLHQRLVVERRWIEEEDFLTALNACMLLPGPEATQLAIAIGYRLQGMKGGLMAGTLFLLPGFFTILALSHLTLAQATSPHMRGLLFGWKAATLGIILMALLQLSRRALKGRPAIAIAALSAILLTTGLIPFPLLILLAGAFGAWTTTADALHPSNGPSDSAHSADIKKRNSNVTQSQLSRRRLFHALTRAGLLLITGILLLAAPLLLIAITMGEDQLLCQQGLFFAQATVTTFGGAYAILTHVAEVVVHTKGWLTPDEMLIGLALAESTPGPLLQVVQHIGFVAAYHNPTPLTPIVAATLAALLISWVTFLPSFLWIFLGAPYLPHLQRNRRLRSASHSITSCAIGAIGALALFFANHAVFAQHTAVPFLGTALKLPSLPSLNAWTLGIATLSFLSLRTKKPSLPLLMAAAAVVGYLAIRCGA